MLQRRGFAGVVRAGQCLLGVVAAWFFFYLIGETLHDDRRGPLSAALWGLNEAVYGSTGVAHTESEVKSYLQGAGFTDVTVHPFVPGVLSRVAGRKPL